MEFELEAIGQQFLNHHLHLVDVWLARYIGLSRQVPLVRFRPGRSAGKLLGMEPVSQVDQIVQRHVRCDDLVASQRIICCGLAGSLGLIVATSNAGFAFAVIRCVEGGGSGIAHAVSGVARSRFKASGAAWVQVPAIDFPSPLSFPSYLPFRPGIVIFTVEPSSVIVVAIGADGRSTV
jgi:hypothetical protein